MDRSKKQGKRANRLYMCMDDFSETTHVRNEPDLLTWIAFCTLTLWVGSW